MSAIAGIYSTDRAPVDEALLLRMREAAFHRGPDGAGFWIGRGVGLAHRLLRNTPESSEESQPMTNGRGFWITADCRIDNRDELKKEFQSKGIWNPGSIYPDAVYILMAYELWGEEAPNHLLGDFAFAIWDEGAQKLFCARDQIGIKPFVYHWNGRRFLFGSEIKQIFQDSSVPEEIHLAHLADILVMNFPNREETPYQAIRRLPPGHSICLENGDFKLQRYWDWDPDSESVSGASVSENAEKFRHLFEEAVRARLRVPSGYRVGSLLSGGLDSSSIVSIAALIQNRSLDSEASGFPVFTLHFPEANPAYQLRNVDSVQETPYSEALIERFGLESQRIEIKGWGPLENLNENLFYQDIPLFFPNLAYFRYLWKVAEKSDVRVLLHGEGGDELFWVGSQCLTNELAKGNFGKFFWEWRQRRKRWGRGYSLTLLESIFRTFLPEWIKVPYRRFFREIIPDWINPQFSKVIHLRERASKDFEWDSHAHASGSYGVLNWLRLGMIAHYLEVIDRAASSTQMEIRLPFVDLRLLQFSATLPWDQKVYGGVSKFLLREALKELLPTSIHNRRRKTEFTPVIRTGLEHYALRQMREAFEEPHPVLRSLIVPQKVQRLFEHYFFSKRPHDSIRSRKSLWHLWYIMSVDQWLKHPRCFRKKEVSHAQQKRAFLAERET